MFLEVCGCLCRINPWVGGWYLCALFSLIDLAACSCKTLEQFMLQLSVCKNIGKSLPRVLSSSALCCRCRRPQTRWLITSKNELAFTSEAGEVETGGSTCGWIIRSSCMLPPRHREAEEQRVKEGDPTLVMDAEQLRVCMCVCRCTPLRAHGSQRLHPTFLRHSPPSLPLLTWIHLQR